MEPLDQILDAPASTQRQLRYAGFWIRVGAYLIDGILLAVVNVILGLVIGSSSGSLGTALLVNAISIAIGLAYFRVFVSGHAKFLPAGTRKNYC